MRNIEEKLLSFNPLNQVYVFNELLKKKSIYTAS